MLQRSVCSCVRFILLIITALALLIPMIHSGVTRSNTKESAFFQNPVVILISFDGFRWDYFKYANLKNFDYVIKHGVKAESMKSSFITKTFPNHFTLVTGLHEETHGIVANRMFDPTFNESFTPRTNDSKWWNAVPIWITNELHRDKTSREFNDASHENRNSTRRSAAIFWVGSNVKYNGQVPSFYFPTYNGSFSTKERLELVVSLLKEENPPNFIACYIAEPDKTGHEYGPDSEEMKQKLIELDSQFGDFLNEMRQNGFLDSVNLVIVSDHGMASIKPQNQIVLNDVINPDWYTAVNLDVFASIRPKTGFKQTIYEKLKNISHMTVYLKSNIPEELHYKNSPRIPDILALADEGYLIKQTKVNITHTIGNHGYLNMYKSMHGIFIAAGPAFKRNYVSETFSNIHVYELLCKVLGLKPSPNNGSVLEVEHFLVDPLQSRHSFFEKLPAKMIIISAISLLLFVILIGVFAQCLKTTLVNNGYIRPSTGDNGTYLYNLTEDFVLEEASSDEDEI